MPNGIEVLWDGIRTVMILMPTTFADKTCGICGNFDGVHNELKMGPNVVGQVPAGACPPLEASGPEGDQVNVARW